jgi:hypothetical protein
MTLQGQSKPFHTAPMASGHYKGGEGNLHVMLSGTKDICVRSQNSSSLKGLKRRMSIS